MSRLNETATNRAVGSNCVRGDFATDEHRSICVAAGISGIVAAVLFELAPLVTTS